MKGGERSLRDLREIKSEPELYLSFLDWKLWKITVVIYRKNLSPGGNTISIIVGDSSNLNENTLSRSIAKNARYDAQ